YLAQMPDDRGLEPLGSRHRLASVARFPPTERARASPRQGREPMRRIRWILLAFVFSLSWIGQASAFEWLDRVCCAIKSEYLKIKLWPEPWIEPDRVATRAPFVVQIANGWRAHNTLGPQHFDPETGDLTHAGMLKVADIMQISPAPHRKIYIER